MKMTSQYFGRMIRFFLQSMYAEKSTCKSSEKYFPLIWSTNIDEVSTIRKMKTRSMTGKGFFAVLRSVKLFPNASVIS